MRKVFNIFTIAFKSILKNKGRNIFTMIGIIIGISSVITIMSLGNGFKKTAADQFSDAGAGKQEALSSFTFKVDEKIKKYPFNQRDIELVNQVDGVLDAKLKENKEEGIEATITNVQKKSDIFIIKKQNLHSFKVGRGFDKEDNELRKKIVVINDQVAKTVFNNNAIGKSLYIEGQGFEVIGITDKLYSDSSTVIMPENTFNYYMGHLHQGLPTLQIIIEDGYNKKTVVKKVESLLNKKGSGSVLGEYTYTDTEEIIKSIDKIFDSITYFVAAVAGISLFIAGIGVMNVMYISVAERTEEIAIRRAFGAKSRDIELQFLIESILICVTSGFIGLILGVVFATIIDVLTPDYIKSVVSLSSVIIAVSVSILIGLLFGWIPARAASKKELIDIIK
ncbi:TPA: ABC transporter permease [Staphylococcus aureus]|nr:ABC transporter permease [Staphylococcus aureus]HDK4577180.1 ABC transporter permease [Staphylococcus aureus]